MRNINKCIQRYRTEIAPNKQDVLDLNDVYEIKRFHDDDPTSSIYDVIFNSLMVGFVAGYDKANSKNKSK